MKILQVITSMRIGGAEKLVAEMVPLMKKAGHEVDILLFDGTETSLKQELKKKGGLRYGEYIFYKSNLHKSKIGFKKNFCA